jgi:ribosomal-protein-alanine N-acetyltransferase
MAIDRVELGLARVGDAQTLALMSRDLIEAGLGWAYRRESIGRFIRDPEAVVLVAREPPLTVGFAIAQYGEERAHLVLLAVMPNHQRHGIGRRMVGWLVQTAQVAGMASIQVELRSSNLPAYALYRAAGFTEAWRMPGYYRGRETAVRMMRVLRVPGATVPLWRPPTLDRH